MTDADGKFTDQVFLGNGDESMLEVGHLYTKLGVVLTVLSSCQQQPHDENSFASVREHAQQIYLALTGEKPWDKKWRKTQKGRDKK